MSFDLQKLHVHKINNSLENPPDPGQDLQSGTDGFMADMDQIAAMQERTHGDIHAEVAYDLATLPAPVQPVPQPPQTITYQQAQQNILQQQQQQMNMYYDQRNITVNVDSPTYQNCRATRQFWSFTPYTTSTGQKPNTNPAAHNTDTCGSTMMVAALKRPICS